MKINEKNTNLKLVLKKEYQFSEINFIFNIN